MYTEINKQLEEAQQGVFRLHKIDAMLLHLSKEQQSLAKKTAELKVILIREHLDVVRLEKRSLAAIFHSVLGNLEQRIEKERSEALSAKLKYDQAVSELEDIRQEISTLSAERAQYQDWEHKFHSLYQQKKEMLLNAGSRSADMLMAAEEKLDSTKNNLKEILEAVAAGNNVLRALENVMSSLDSAKNWGVWDLLGGGLLADLAKHSHIDDAKAEVERVQSLLRRFNTELADVKLSADIAIDIGGFAKFADFFFDGLIADFFMQSKINDSRDSVIRVKAQVQGVLAKLATMEKQELAEIERLKREIKNLVTSS